MGRARGSPINMSAADITKALNDDDLQEILLRLPFATSLVRSASVCRRWLRVARDPGFLRRFRDLHPPPLLGFYVEAWRAAGFSKFVPMPHLPKEEFAPVVRRLARQRAGKGLDAYISILDCRNGHLLVRRHSPDCQHAVVSPLHGERGAAAVLPPLPSSFPVHSSIMCLGADGASVVAGRQYPDDGDTDQTVVELHKLKLHDDRAAWHRLSLNKVDVRASYGFLLNGKVYIIPKPGATIAALHLEEESSTSTDHPSIIALPDGIADISYARNSMMSLADDSAAGLYRLIRLDTVGIRVWLHRTDDNSWSLVDSISLSEVCTEAGLQTGYYNEAKLLAVGDNAEFLFLQLWNNIRNDVVYVHFKSRVVEKVYTMTGKDCGLIIKLAPFTVTWPPKFPVIN